MANIKGNKSNILTKEQKIKVLKESDEGDLSQKEIAQKYQISLSSLKSWMKKYKEFGETSLISQTGKTNAQKFKKSNLDSKDQEISRLSKVVKQQEMELKILKKFDEWMRKKPKTNNLWKI